MKTNKVNNAIENMLGGQTDKAGDEWLIEEMKKNPGLNQEVKLRRKTDEILADRQIIDLRNKLKVIERGNRSAGTVRRLLVKSSRYAAAVAIVALLSTALYLGLRSGSSPDELYATFYSGYESSGAARSAENSGNTLMENALASYSAREYEKAIIYLEQVIKSDGDDMESVFMHGMANMEVKNYPGASGSFTRVIEHNDNLYLEDATWYLGLCYMMTGNNEKAVTQFKAIASSRSRYAKQAGRLARRLN